MSATPSIPWAPVIDALPNSSKAANSLSLAVAAITLSSAAVLAAEAPSFNTAPAAMTPAPATAPSPKLNGASAISTPPMPISKLPNASTAPVIDLVNVSTPFAPTAMPRSPWNTAIPICFRAFAAPSSAAPANFAPAVNSSIPAVAPTPPPANLIRLSLPASTALLIEANLPDISLIEAPGFARSRTVFVNFSCSFCNCCCIFAASTTATCCCLLRSENFTFDNA